MARFILFLDRLFNFYIYYVIGACVLSWVPNINPDYPLFDFLFKSAGFYIIPPFMGLSFSPALVVFVCAMVSIGLRKLYIKLFEKNKPEVIILTKEEFEKKLNEYKDINDNSNEVDKNDCI